jgi:hypothetical protein
MKDEEEENPEIPENGEQKTRRSPRLAQQIPIRVYGTNSEGRSFYEDSSTLVVNQGGGLIRLGQDLAPDHHVFIFCHPTNQGGRFRVVGEHNQSETENRYWGVELLTPEENIWGVEFPDLGPEDIGAVRVLLACPSCERQERMSMNESEVELLHERGGLERECPACKVTSLWKEVPFLDEA